MQFAIGLAVTLPLALAFEGLRVRMDGGPRDLARLPGPGKLAGVAIALLLMMIRRSEASRVSALVFLVPPLAALIAWAVLGESLPGVGLDRHGPGRRGRGDSYEDRPRLVLKSITSGTPSSF